MSEDATYTLTPMLAPDDIAAFDQDYFFYQLRREVSEAEHFLDEEGESTGAGGEWDGIVEDLKPFSLKHPKVLILVEEKVTYERTHEVRYYIQNGKSAEIEPVISWPEFSPDMLK